MRGCAALAGPMGAILSLLPPDTGPKWETHSVHVGSLSGLEPRLQRVSTCTQQLPVSDLHSQHMDDGGKSYHGLGPLSPPATEV